MNTRTERDSFLEAENLPITRNGEKVRNWSQEDWRAFLETTSLDTYTELWLKFQCALIDGVNSGVVVLGPADKGPYSPIANWPSDTATPPGLSSVAELAMQERRGVLRNLKNSEKESEANINLAYPILICNRLHGVVGLSVELSATRSPTDLMRQLQWGAIWLERFFYKTDEKTGTTGVANLATVLDLIVTSIDHEKFHGAATTVVTELASKMGCERVSLGVLKGNYMRVIALSHSAEFGKKMNLISTIGAAMDEAMDQRASVVFPSDRTQSAAIVHAHGVLSKEFGARNICSVLIIQDQVVHGVITLERSQENPFDDCTVELCETIASIVGPILLLKQRDDRWLGAKVMYSARANLAKLFGPSHAALKLSVIGLLALTAILFFVEDDYRVTAETVLEGAIQRAVVAPFAGYIATAHVRAGDVVKSGQIMFQLDDKELLLERSKQDGQRKQLLREYRDALANHERSEIRVLRAQLDQTEAEIALVDRQLEHSQGRAPIDGVVVDGDLSQSLGAPVKRGDRLFEIAPLDAYRIILKIDERDINEIVEGQSGQLVLSSGSGEVLDFSVEKITPVSEAEEGRNYFRVEASPEQSPEYLRPGMEGVGKVLIGRRKIVWLWTHRIIDWFRLWKWNWLP